MIFGILKLLLIGFLVLSVIYVVLSLYLRSLEYGRLEREWEEDRPGGDREAFLDAGMEAYRHSLRRKLVFGVYVLPLVALVVILYVVNFM